jgi:predicted Zn-dependent protease
MVIGMAAAVVAGPEVGSAIMSGGSNVALRNLLQYSRTQEGAADAAAMRYLTSTKQSAQGLLDFFGVLSQQEFLTPERQDPYLRSHPLTEDRIKALADFVERSPYSKAPTDPALQEKHRRMLAKLRAFLEDPALTRRRYPESDQSLEARYARAIAYHRAADLQSALASIDGLIAEYPADPYFRELRGQILMERGRPADSIADYQAAVKLLPDAPLLRVDLARAQLATNERSLLDPAIQNLRAAIQREPARPFVWRQLAIAYGRNGQEAESSLALAEEAILLGKVSEARYHAGKAERLVPSGSPGWLQAQDILQAANQREQR